MKKTFTAIVAIVLAVVMVLALSACGQTEPFKVGKDTATYVMDGHSEWAATYSAYVKIVSGEDVLFNGTVTLTSDNMYVSEFTYAAITEKSIAQAGVLEGFITSIGSYVSGPNADDVYMFWGYTVNGKTVNWGCNDVHILEGDYILWEFQASTF